MSAQILKAMQANEMHIRKGESSIPTTPKGGLLSRTGSPSKSDVNTPNNIASYVKQIRAARNKYA